MQFNDLTQAKKEIAQKIGESEVRIGILKHDLGDKLMQQGVIVDLRIGRWRGLKRITREDLGLGNISEEECEYFPDYFSLGQKKLLPPKVAKQFDVIDSRSRSCLEAHSFSTVWDGSETPKSHRLV